MKRLSLRSRLSTTLACLLMTLYLVFSAGQARADSFFDVFFEVNLDSNSGFDNSTLAGDLNVYSGAVKPGPPSAPLFSVEPQPGTVQDHWLVGIGQDPSSNLIVYSVWQNPGPPTSPDFIQIQPGPPQLYFTFSGAIQYPPDPGAPLGSVHQVYAFDPGVERPPNPNTDALPQITLCGIGTSPGIACETTADLWAFSDPINIGTITAHITPVPEPGTMLLLGSGIAGLAMLRIRFKR